MINSLLEVQQLKVAFKNHQNHQAVNEVSFHVKRGEIVALVGMSGSGKTVTALSILQLMANKAAVHTSGNITYHSAEGKTYCLHKLSNVELRKLRGSEIGLVFQNGQQALNPSIACGKQVEEALLAHQSVSKARVQQAVLQLFDELGLSKDLYSKYPQQLSGGQQQRILIAIAICCKPALIIADEPTASLDKQTQQEVVKLLLGQCRKRNTALLLITHDISLVSEVADRVLVMHQGKLIEENTMENILLNPQQPFTKHLVESYHLLQSAAVPVGKLAASFLSAREVSLQQPLLKVEKLCVSYRIGKGWFKPGKQVQVLKELDLEIFSGETLGLLGRSGSGKSTLAKALMALQQADSGTVRLDGENLMAASNEGSLYKKVQMVFQDAHASLDPRMTVAESMLEPLRFLGVEESEEQRKLLVKEFFNAVGLEAPLLDAYPHELSGGQRQRVAIARALVLRPKLLIFDEPVASLDAVLQLQVLKLLQDLKSKYQLTYLFISHDISALKFMADRILEMKDGQLFTYQAHAGQLPQHILH